jgi:hypothetical protein
MKNHTHEWNTFISWFIDWKVLLLFIKSFFFIACIYLEIEFIKPSDDGVKIQQKTITFTKNYTYRTVFINKMINSGIRRMFIFFVFIHFALLVMCYAFSQILGMFLVWEIYFFFIVIILIFFLLNNLMRNRHCIWIETRGPQR